MSGTITINGVELCYRSHPFMGTKFMVTYLTDYDKSVLFRLNDIARIVFDCKCSRIIPYNTLSECNKVAERISLRLKFEQSSSSIIIAQHVTRKKIVLGGGSIPYNEEDVAEIYGSQLCITGSAFHALSYVNFLLVGYGDVHIAIDGSSSSRVDEYFVNMIIAPSLEELEQVIKTRYQYRQFAVCEIFDHPDKF
jgi:hypothetical protein